MKGYSGMIGTIVTVFTVAVLSAFIAGGGDVFSVGTAGLKTLLSAGALAVAAFLVAYFNKHDTRYGVGSEDV
ncbi:MAG: hypothetical protein MUQ56_08755 [Thermoleophilia bacterium]|nr:hypothetical protein [Thermoleophilia bacterium]